MGSKYIVYQRVSLEEMAEKGCSLRAQLEVCRSHIKSRGGELIKVYEDAGYSGTLEPTKRPALNQLLTDIKNKEFVAEKILVYKIDRFCRNARDLLNVIHVLTRANVTLESCTETIDVSSPSGKLLLGLLGSAGQFESEQIGARTFNCMRSRVGELPLGGTPPIGYQLRGKSYAIDKLQAETVKEIFTQFLKLKHYCKTATFLNERSTFTAQGKLWNHKSIKYVLLNPIYIGKIAWNKRKGRMRTLNPVGTWIIKEGRQIPLVSTETFEKVQKIISRNEGRR